MRDDSTLKILAFHGMGRDDREKHWFMCEVIWSMKHIVDERNGKVPTQTFLNLLGLSEIERIITLGLQPVKNLN